MENTNSTPAVRERTATPVTRQDAATARAELAPEAQPNPYVGASMLQLTPEEISILVADPADDELDIKGSGEVYMSHAAIRDRLNRAIGPGQWSVMRDGKPEIFEGRLVIYPIKLYVRGHYIAEAIGETPYHKNNSKGSYTRSLEGAKSDAIRRACKDLMTPKCWSKRFTEAWRNEQCVRVQTSRGMQWRRIDADPLPGESQTKPAASAAMPKRKNAASEKLSGDSGTITGLVDEAKQFGDAKWGVRVGELWLGTENAEHFDIASGLTRSENHVEIDWVRRDGRVWVDSICVLPMDEDEANGGAE